MPVFIKKQDGQTKEYPVGSPITKDYTHSKCGEIGCDHLDCAIEYAKEMVTVNRLIISVLVLMAGSLVFITLLIAYFQWPGILDGVFWTNPDNVIGIILIAGIIFLIFSLRKLSGARKSLEELLEFKERGTVNSLPARQVSAKTAKKNQKEK